MRILGFFVRGRDGSGVEVPEVPERGVVLGRGVVSQEEGSEERSARVARRMWAGGLV